MPFKWLVPFCCLLSLGVMAPKARAQAPAQAEHAILVVIDGSQPDAWRYMLDSESNPGVDPNDYR